MRLFVQATSDGVPVLYPQWAIPTDLTQYGVRNDLISRLTFSQFQTVAQLHGKGAGTLASLLHTHSTDLTALSRGLAASWSTLKEALDLLPPQVHLDLHIIYPNRAEEEELHLGPTGNINHFIDSILTVVFDHAKQLRGADDGLIRSMVFTSYNQQVCTALNWKQPNCELNVDN